MRPKRQSLREHKYSDVTTGQKFQCVGGVLPHHASDDTGSSTSEEAPQRIEEAAVRRPSDMFSFRQQWVKRNFAVAKDGNNPPAITLSCEIVSQHSASCEAASIAPLPGHQLLNERKKLLPSMEKCRLGGGGDRQHRNIIIVALCQCAHPPSRHPSCHLWRQGQTHGPMDFQDYKISCSVLNKLALFTHRGYIGFRPCWSEWRGLTQCRQMWSCGVGGHTGVCVAQNWSGTTKMGRFVGCVLGYGRPGLLSIIDTFRAYLFGSDGSRSMICARTGILPAAE